MGDSKKGSATVIETEDVEDTGSGTGPDEIKEESDSERQTTLYLAAAYGVKCQDDPGINVVWGEKSSVLEGGKVLLEGNVATLILKCRPMIYDAVGVVPNKGIIVIEETDGYYYFPHTLNFRYDIASRLRSRRNICSLLWDDTTPDADVEKILARKMLAEPSKYHRHILDSRVRRQPDSIRFPAEHIEDLVEIAWKIGGSTVLTAEGDEFRRMVAKKIYDSFMRFREGFADYSLFDEGVPGVYRDFSIETGWRPRGGLSGERCPYYNLEDMASQIKK